MFITRVLKVNTKLNGSIQTESMPCGVCLLRFGLVEMRRLDVMHDYNKAKDLFALNRRKTTICEMRNKQDRTKFMKTQNSGAGGLCSSQMWARGRL